MDDVRLLHEQYELLNINKREIATRWVELIVGNIRRRMSNIQHVVNLACLLELQYKIQNDEDDFSSLTCPMVRDIWGKSVLPKLVSVQPIIGNHPLYYKRRNLNGEWLKADPVQVQPRYNALRAVWNPKAVDLAGEYHDYFMHEVSKALSDEIRIEHERRVLAYLCKNTRLEADLDLSQVDLSGSWKNKLHNQLPEISKKISGKIGREPNWIVTSPELATAFEYDDECFHDHNYVGVSKVTSHDDFQVYKDPLFPSHVMLMGFKGNEDIDAGFIYAVSEPLVLGSHIDEYSDRQNFGTFADCRFVENGEDWYIKINVRNMLDA